VNLNTATQEDLQTLTGIGPSKADAILEYRETVGKFKEVDELKQVTGIGDKTFERLRDSISVK
jgi:competence protein ComEA